jgi:hypothetical protein
MRALRKAANKTEVRSSTLKLWRKRKRRSAMQLRTQYATSRAATVANMVENQIVLKN